MSRVARDHKIGLNATWSMAVGGMVGGGIFSVLGVVVGVAGPWAWLSFVLAGLISLATGSSYVQLTAEYRESGGIFIFLRHAGQRAFADTLSWILIIGYMLTNSVYAFTFGHYLAAAGGWHNPLFPRVFAAVVIAFVVGLNLLGIGESARFEIIAVWGKLAILFWLSAVGLAHWHSANFHASAGGGGIGGAFLGGAVIFMAYEGFQLVTYDYDVIRDPRRTLPIAVLGAILAVIFVYVAVTLGAMSLIGQHAMVRQKEIALAVAGRAAFGAVGMILVSVAAAFSTGSAINATVFATARLTKKVASAGELPELMAHENRKGIPDHAVLALGIVSGALAIVGSLSDLVEAASLIFLFTFAAVNVLAFLKLRRPSRWVSLAGAIAATAAFFVLSWRLLTVLPAAFGGLMAVIVLAILARPLFQRLRRSNH